MTTMTARDTSGSEARAEILDVAGMYAADAAAMKAGVPGRVLMERAGRAVAGAALRLLAARGRERGRVLVLAGPGNNGGDGFVAARVLAGRGVEARLALLGARARLKGDAAWAAGLWRGEVLPLADVREAEIERADVIIDALFGAGLDRPLQGEAARVVRAVNAARNTARAPVVAVDVPSGVHGDSGQPLGAAVHADVTVTFFRKKPAHLLLPGRDLCGEVTVADTGIPEAVLEHVPPVAHENTPALWRADVPAPAPDAHKYSRGSVLVLSGGALRTGASRLAAMAALKGGAGAVTLIGEADALKVHAAHVTEIMLRPVGEPRALKQAVAEKHANTLVIGPAAGVNARTRAFTLTALRETGLRLVLDADVFSAFADAPDELFAAIRARVAAVVMTPHMGEFARLFPDLAAAEESKLSRAKQAARRAGCVVLLKGPDTVIADEHGHAIIEACGPPWLATAGSGDVLAGLVAALLAQGMPPLKAAAAAAWLHARAAHEAGGALIASELIAPAARLKAALARRRRA